MATSEWTPAKVKSFRAAYMNFRKYVTINSKEEGQILLGDKMYGSQRMFLDCVFDGLSRGIHDFKVLKSRQVGITTETRALSLFWLGMHAGLKGTLVFDDAPHLNEARNEFVTMMDNLPPHLDFPKKKRGNQIFFGKIFCRRSSGLYTSLVKPWMALTVGKRRLSFPSASFDSEK